MFLKPADRIEDGAQVAIVNADGSGFEELTAGLGNNAFPSFAPDGKRRNDLRALSAKMAMGSV